MKLKIDNDEIAEAFFENARVLGIMAPVKNYQFVWQINQRLGYTFRLNNDIEIELRKKTRNYFFSIYEYRVPQTTTCYFLYHNQHMGEYLLPEFRNIDFIWLIQADEWIEEEVEMLKESIRKIPSVQFLNELSVDKIKNKQHLIF